MALLAPMIWAFLAQQPTVPLRGGVSDADGRPVAGAEVVLVGLPEGQSSPVIGRARTGDAGTFAIGRPRDLAGRDSYNAPTLWVIPPGGRIILRKFAAVLPAEGEPIRVATRPATKTEVRVETPGGDPVAGAKVRVVRLNPEFAAVPDAVAELTGRTTDAQGVAQLDAFAPEDVGTLEVRADGFGTQSRGYFPATIGPKRVGLRPVGSVAGRLVADDPALVKGWKVQMNTRPDNTMAADFWPMGHGEAIVDAEGRFALPAIAEGSLDFYLDYPDGTTVLPVFATPYKVVAGRENTVEIPIKKASKVTGIVRERGTGKPIAGVKLQFQRPGESSVETTGTDATGRYTFASLVGKGRLSLSTVPPGYVLMIGIPRGEIDVPDRERTVEVAPIDILTAAPPIRGVVRDEDGRPMAGVKLGGDWTIAEAGERYRIGIAATTGEDGSFEIAGVAPGAAVTLTARQRDKATAQPVKVRAGEAAPVALRLSAADTTALAGRVLGPGDRPVTNAIIKVVYQTRTPHMGTQGWGQAQFDDNAIVRTGPDGTYRTPKELDRPDREFKVEVTAEGYLPNESNWVSAGEEQLVRMPDLRLRKVVGLRSIRGRVVDREGKPIAGAKAFQSGDGPSRTEATTDAAGRFRLDGLHAGPALVFAEKEGYRFGGAIAGADSVEVRLAGVGGPPIRALKSLPPKLSRAEERKLGLALLAPVLARPRAGALPPSDSGFGSASPLTALARLDPERVLTMIENRVVAQPAEILRQAAIAQYEDDPREAISTIEADGVPSARASGFLALAGVEPDRDRRFALIDRALAENRKVEQPEMKLSVLGYAAGSLIDDGALDRATPLLREGQKILAGFKNWQYEGERFAEVLGVIDLPAARAIIERKGVTNVSPTDPNQIGGHLAEVAARLAATDPGGAEALIDALPKDFYNREGAALRTGMAMAPRDPARARKLLAKLGGPAYSPSYRNPLAGPYGLGLLASAVAGTDPKAAGAMLDESFAALRKAAGERSAYNASAYMAALLPVVKRVAPDRLEESLMLAASLRPPRAAKADAMALLEAATLAPLIARYDRDVAAVVFGPVADALPELAAKDYGLNINGNDLTSLVVAYDPQVIVDLIAGLPDSARKVKRTADGNVNPGVEMPARLRAAEMLGLPPAARRREALRNRGVYQPPPQGE